MIDVQYENRIVIFIDILGTKVLVEKTVEDNDLLWLLHDKLKYITSTLTRGNQSYNASDNYKINYRTSHFSDSFVVSILVDEEQFFLTSHAVVTSIQLIYECFLQIGVLVRGGITIGQVLHDENILFGPGLVEAYELESKHAIYPRVVFSNKVVSLFSDYYDTDAGYQFSNLMLNVKKDDDGYFYFDYINSNYLYAPDLKISYMLKTLECLTQIDETNEKLNAKYAWLKNKIIAFESTLNYESLIFQIESIREDRIKYTGEEIIAIKSALNEYKDKVLALKNNYT